MSRDELGRVLGCVQLGAGRVARELPKKDLREKQRLAGLPTTRKQGLADDDESQNGFSRSGRQLSLFNNKVLLGAQNETIHAEVTSQSNKDSPVRASFPDRFGAFD